MEGNEGGKKGGGREGGTKTINRNQEIGRVNI